MIAYHWSPRERFYSIDHNGLTTHNQNINGPVYHDEEQTDEFLQPYVCLSTSPYSAWALSAQPWRRSGIYDLWEVDIPDDYTVQYLESANNDLVELRVSKSIPRNHIMWIGERTE